MVVKFFVTFIMVTGLFCTVTLKLPGTLLILLGAAFYGAVTGYVSVAPWLVALLVLISITAEVGGRVLRLYLTRNYSVSPVFSVNCTATHLAGMLATNALLGPLLGLAVWELVAGKTLLPRGDTVTSVLLRLAGVACLRFACGLIMIVLIHMYLFLP
ncbi:conserved membrane hypothetical protein [uncultured Sporomusa sp.]|uniref:DUF456 domain-containing protein n=1 Tax=uncultured Sporomusa sp. TaxID=307249 RepID=A0A212LRL9_9FIRM|nr:conserved membrane hypothetical protein [uncultured Sporomusa sp.]